MKAQSNYRDVEDLSPEEMDTLDHLERMVKSYEGLAFSTNGQDELYRKLCDFETQLESYKKEIGLA